MMINSIICEHPLPLPSSIIDEYEDFSEIVWDEHTFYTSSFFDAEGEADSSIYTITSDGQFYKECIETEVKVDKKGKVYSTEKSKGVERQDFTGLIYFGAEILG